MKPPQNTKTQYIVLYCLLAVMTITFILVVEWLQSIMGY